MLLCPLQGRLPPEPKVTRHSPWPEAIFLCRGVASLRSQSPPLRPLLKGLVVGSRKLNADC